MKNILYMHVFPHNTYITGVAMLCILFPVVTQPQKLKDALRKDVCEPSEAQFNISSIN